VRYGPFGPQAGVTLVGIPYQTGVFVRLTQVLPNGVTDTSPIFGFQTSWCGYNFGGIIAPSVAVANAIASGGTSSTADFCATHACIPNFPAGRGFIVQCNDGTYSQSGGIQGACSGHGGVR
jgi:hypothetical protein